MASSPDDRPWSPDDERVPRPWLAIVAVTVAVLTLLIGLAAAIYAGFFFESSP